MIWSYGTRRKSTLEGEEEGGGHTPRDAKRLRRNADMKRNSGHGYVQEEREGIGDSIGRSCGAARVTEQVDGSSLEINTQARGDASKVTWAGNFQSWGHGKDKVTVWLVCIHALQMRWDSPGEGRIRIMKMILGKREHKRTHITQNERQGKRKSNE